MLKASSNTSVELLLNDQWLIDVKTFDDDGRVVDVVPVITVISPNSETVVVVPVKITTGHYRASVTVLTAGRFIATATALGYGSVAFSANVADVVLGTAFPTVVDIKAYADLESWSDQEIQAALNAELSQQRKRCNVGAVYPADLAEALKRRVVRNLAMRRVVLPTEMMGDANGGNSGYLPFNDPEIRRLEAPYRRVVLM